MSTDPTPRPRRGAIWCDHEVASLVTQVAHLRGKTVREYMRDLAAVVRQHKVQAVDALSAELRAS
jgi:hypothetical protein